MDNRGETYGSFGVTMLQTIFVVAKIVEFCIFADVINDMRHENDCRSWLQME